MRSNQNQVNCVNRNGGLVNGCLRQLPFQRLFQYGADSMTWRMAMSISMPWGQNVQRDPIGLRGARTKGWERVVLCDHTCASKPWGKRADEGRVAA